MSVFLCAYEVVIFLLAHYTFVISEMSVFHGVSVGT